MTQRARVLVILAALLSVVALATYSVLFEGSASTDNYTSGTPERSTVQLGRTDIEVLRNTVIADVPSLKYGPALEGSPLCLDSDWRQVVTQQGETRVLFACLVSLKEGLDTTPTLGIDRIPVFQKIDCEQQNFYRNNIYGADPKCLQRFETVFRYIKDTPVAVRVVFALSAYEGGQPQIIEESAWLPNGIQCKSSIGFLSLIGRHPYFSIPELRTNLLEGCVGDASRTYESLVAAGNIKMIPQ